MENPWSSKLLPLFLKRGFVFVVVFNAGGLPFKNKLIVSNVVL